VEALRALKLHSLSQRYGVGVVHPLRVTRELESDQIC
jgi:hypothetical protein